MTRSVEVVGRNRGSAKRCDDGAMVPRVARVVGRETDGRSRVGEMRTAWFQRGKGRVSVELRERVRSRRWYP